MADQPLTPEIRTARRNALGDVLTRSAARHRGKTAIIDGDTTLSYTEFDQVVTNVAANLQRLGINTGDRLALVSRNSWEFAAIAWGAARVGVMLVPINFMLVAEEIAYILDHAEVSGVIVQAEFGAALDGALATATTSPAVRLHYGADDTPEGWDSVDELFVAAPEGWEAPTIDDDAPIRLMYTSGTESRPKGAMLSSRSLIAEYTSAIVDGGMTSDDVDLHTLPLYHCAQLDCFLGPDLMLGATSIILPAPAPDVVLAKIAEHKVTKYFAPPTVWISLLRNPGFDDADLSSLKRGYYGASIMPVEVLNEVSRRLPNVRLWNFYGQTELAPVATILQPEEQVSHAGSAGFPTLNVQTILVDDDNNEVPQGEVGEVVHRSPHATLGYWRDEAKTAEAFKNGWFHSGDLGVFDAEGRLSIVDRKKDMIKSGGENVASREVEETIYAHPDVAEVAVFGLPDAKWVEAVTAAVVARPGSDLTAETLAAYCAEHLAPYKRPKRIEIVESLPKNPSGKILKRELRDTMAD
ncbi:fatty acyl-CoA synthetase [Kribbia dieselivorans]|uniref:fatty acyl-CoA synthetase n=1 Tax=Kribbia dieselivorans TaxID=331526 RepID=UPI0008388883|nr:fatty acyl-CoA synthetase [Kribbia dieselivorans]